MIILILCEVVPLLADVVEVNLMLVGLIITPLILRLIIFLCWVIHYLFA